MCIIFPLKFNTVEDESFCSFEDEGLCFVLGEHTEREPDARVNMKRFVDQEILAPVKVEYRAGRRIWESLTEEACEALREAGRYHIELEKIYSSCMDFEAEKAFVKLFCEKIK